MKTTIKNLKPNRCSITFADGITDEICSMELFAPIGGGYVKIEANGYPQICERLTRTGNTLMWDGAGELADLIRREYRRMRRSEKTYQLHHS
jgi:hypothetical protein